MGRSDHALEQVYFQVFTEPSPAPLPHTGAYVDLRELCPTFLRSSMEPSSPILSYHFSNIPSAHSSIHSWFFL